MKHPISTRIVGLAALAFAGLSFSALAADNYSVFRICEDQHILKTSDGADAGHIEYIVVDPGQQRIVSSVITGGVVGTRHVSVPYSEFQVTGDRDIVFRQITRERIVGAPVIEVDRFRTSSFVEPAFIEKSSTYFNVRVSGEAGRDLREPRDERQLAPGERSNDPRSVRDDQKDLRPGERATDPRSTVRDDQKQLPPGERANDPRNAARDEQDRNLPPRNGNVRDNRAGTPEEPANTRGQAGTNSAPPTERNADERTPRGNNEPHTAREGADQKVPPASNERKAESTAAEDTRAEKSRAAERFGKNGKAESTRTEGAAEAKEKRAEGSQKSEVTEEGTKHSKKAETTKEEKSSTRSSSEKSEKGERKEPKGDEPR